MWPTLLLAACLGGAPTPLPGELEAQHLRLDLDAAWTERPWDSPSPQGPGALRTEARFVLEEERLRPSAVLVLEGVEGAVTVTVNGQALRPPPTGIAPLRVGVADLLRAGDNHLVVEVEAPAPDAEALVLGTRARGARLAAAPRLELGPGVITELAAGLRGDRVDVEVEAPGAARVEVYAALDGEVVQALGEAALVDGRAALEPVAWQGPRWGAGQESDLLHLWAVARDADGRVLDARAWRTGLREVAPGRGSLAVGAHAAPLVVLRHGHGPLAGTLAQVHDMGLSGIELHGPPVVGEWLSLADELDVAVVVMPRCDGKVQSSTARLRAHADTLAEQDDALLQAVWPHPSLLLWSVEGGDDVVPRLAAPFARDPVPRVAAGVHVASRAATQLQPPPEVDGPWWCNEVNAGPHPTSLPPDAGPRTVEALVAAGALGTVAPPQMSGAGQAAPADAWQRIWRETSDRLGVRRPAQGRRASARVRVSGLHPGQVAWLSGPQLPATGAAAGPDGVALLSAWGRGAARLQVGERERTIELSPGRWTPDPAAPADQWLDRAWRGSVTTVAWEEAR